MNRQYSLDTLEFQDHGIFDDDVYSVTAVEFQALVLDGQRYLPLKMNTSEMKFVAETLLVSRFHESGTKFFVDLNGSADHLIREFLKN